MSDTFTRYHSRDMLGFFQYLVRAFKIFTGVAFMKNNIVFEVNDGFIMDFAFIHNVLVSCLYISCHNVLI